MADSHDHHHVHQHDHAGDHAHNGKIPIDAASFTEVNRAHWNKFAASYTSEQWQKDLVNHVNAFILTNISWIGVDFIDPATAFEKDNDPAKTVRILDYACGPGTITHALAGRATEYIGLDLSENMVKAYNLRFNPDSDQCAANPLEDQGEEEKLNAHAEVGNLLDPAGTPPAFDDPKYKDFDLVVVGLGFHHFRDLDLTMSRLLERLRPGGVFLIVDFVSHDAMKADDGNPAAPTVAHNGFSEQRLKQIFEGAGLTEFGMRVFGEKVMLRGLNPRELLLAKGRKPEGKQAAVL
ncbi:hypothetical protein LTR84_000995 [Exophiala bonariae]|uniref:Methyltransferase domain-containing protein n=1 Tax=Exophiala bonariae TaxID=1690606 RepID=A0AAV9NS58_9EURO|nr:hypothetical protein LTR84_000995 [Exophiala bonariae]